MRRKCFHCGYAGPNVGKVRLVDGEVYLCRLCMSRWLLHFEAKLGELEARIEEVKHDVDALRRGIKLTPPRPSFCVSEILKKLKKGKEGEIIDKQFHPVKVITLQLGSEYISGVKALRYRYPVEFAFYYVDSIALFLASNSASEEYVPIVTEGALYFKAANMFQLRELLPVNEMTRELITFLKITSEPLTYETLAKWARRRGV